MAAVQGWGTRLGFGVESAYGDSASRTIFLRPVSVALSSKSVLAVTDNLTGASTSYEAQYRDRMNTEAGGSISWEPGYEGEGLLWQAMMGTTATTTGTNPYTHNLHLGQTFSSLTCEVVRGTAVQGGTTVSEVFDGMMCTSWSLSCAVGQRAKIESEWIAETSAGPAGTPTSATYTANRSALIGHQITLVWNSATYKAYSVKIGVDRALERDYPLGSRLTLQPLATRGPVVMVEAELRIEDWTIITGQQAGTEATATITISDGTNSLTFTARKVAWDEAPVSHSSQGKQTVTVRGQALGATSSSTTGLSMVVVNTQSSFTAQ